MLRNNRFYYIIFISIFFLTGCGEKIEPGNVELSKKEHVKAPVVSAKIISQPFFYESVGTVSANIVSTISSKLMGTVREVFVREGDRVNKGQTVCIVEAMKLMNEIESETSGTIVRILVENAQPVEFGQAMFLIEPD